MAEQNTTNNDIIDMFGLSFEQTRLLFSLQKMLTDFDCNVSIAKKDYSIKREWLQKWEKSVLSYLDEYDGDAKPSLIEPANLADSFKEEIKKSPLHTWYYIIILEGLTFEPYYALGTDNDKKYAKCSYGEKACLQKLKEFFVAQNIVSEDKIDRLLKTYNKSMRQISGSTLKIATRVVSVIAISAIAAAAAAISAPAIAVALFGGAFEGLSGAALVSACLAMAGGGAIAAGGAGMAGGVVAIAGGGALLGLAGGGAVVGVASKLLLESPDYTLSQAAKLETILKEVILNAQKDVVSAQKIIKQYQTQIDELNKKITELEMSGEKHKQEIKNLKICLKYIKKSCKDMNVFASSYAEGKRVEEEDA